LRSVLRLFRPFAAASVLLLVLAAQGCGGEGRGPGGGSRERSVGMSNESELRELPPDGGPGHNRLVFEKSPYLLQHARNPVDWYPWGEEAFERARRADKPVFLSIGYSTCHWCHVMEEESFEDEAVARLLNDAFVCVKVDREERPDIDATYMAVCQAMTGRGGWPLTIIVTPDKKPFFAATYVPRDSRYGTAGLVELIPRVKEVWSARREEVLDQADKITETLREASGRCEPCRIGRGLLAAAYEGLAARHDAGHGGFGDAPKFPQPHNLTFLLRYWRRTGEAEALGMVERTLSAMRQGGIYDHIGFGFHRYSTDAEWLVPHFEKMLYDQALLAEAYVQAYRASGRPEYARTAEQVFEYVLREMTSPDGGFYSAEDADSEGEEGKFYLWTRTEILDVLGSEEGGLFCSAFGVPATEREAGHPGGLPHPTVLHEVASTAETARRLGVAEPALRDRLEASRRTLFVARSGRTRPGRDEKMLADWNGLMIGALADGAAVLGEARYAGAASRAADFVLSRMTGKDGTLLHRFCGGSAGIPGFLDDYAFTIWGLLRLYEAAFDCQRLETALALAGTMIERFWDEEGGGFFLAQKGGEELILRNKDAYDGALPSGNSIAALDLAMLGRIAGRADLEEKARRTIEAFSGERSGAPFAYSQMMSALDFAMGPSYEVVLAGDPGRLPDDPMVRALRSAYLPNAVVVFRSSVEESPPITRIAKYTAPHGAIGGRTTAYVCSDYACEEPTTDPDRMLELLGVR